MEDIPLVIVNNSSLKRSQKLRPQRKEGQTIETSNIIKLQSC